VGEIKLDGYICERCRHTWISRVNSKNRPLVCPSCKSPYWNIPRKNNSDKLNNSKNRGKNNG